MNNREDHDFRPGRGWRLPGKAALNARILSGVIVVLAGVMLLEFLPDFIVNRYVRPGVIEGFANAYPSYAMRIAGMRYSVWQNRVRCDSVSVTSADSSFSCTVAGISIGGIRRTAFFRRGNPVAGDFLHAVVDVNDIGLKFPQKQYEIQCGLLHFSVPDSELTVDGLRVHPLRDDDQFFAHYTFRTSRLRLAVPHASASGLACLALLQDNEYRARSTQVEDMLLDILVNKDKPRTVDSASPPGPKEILAAIAGVLSVDSLTVVNGRLLYGEQYAVGSKAALIALDSLHVLVKGIAQHGDPGDTLLILAEARFMRAGRMTFLLSIPGDSREFSYRYAGSMSGMELSVLDSFLETAEQVRIKTGVLQGATFDITVASGRARGNVRAVYTDFTLAAINSRTGSEHDLPDAVASFIANTFTIRGTNVPDKSGALRTGEVSYTRKRDESFLQFSWFALRSGVRDVVGL